jgi:two-component system nitrogen regulation response regulator GlnG
LFLDEIGDMTPLTQTKVLRILQEQRFERVGGNETIQTNVRLIAATNRDLKSMADADQFRGDLYYRLSVFTISLPPLRQRGDDVPLLVEHFLRRFSRELGKEVYHCHPEALAILRRHLWPGNLRELQSVLKQALLQATGPVLLPDFLPLHLRAAPQGASALPSVSPGPDWEKFLDERMRAGARDLFAEWQQLTERHLITKVLRYTNGNQVKAAQILGVARNSLRNKLRSLGITIGRSVGSE